MWSLRIRVPWGHERENAVGASAETGADRAASTESWDWVGTSGCPARGAPPPPPQGRSAGEVPQRGTTLGRTWPDLCCCPRRFPDRETHHTVNAAARVDFSFQKAH